MHHLLKRFHFQHEENTGLGRKSVWGAVSQDCVFVVPERGIEGSRVAGCRNVTYLKDRKGLRQPRKTVLSERFGGQDG